MHKARNLILLFVRFCSSGQAFLTASLIPDIDLSELFDQIEVPNGEFV